MNITRKQSPRAALKGHLRYPRFIKLLIPLYTLRFFMQGFWSDIYRKSIAIASCRIKICRCIDRSTYRAFIEKSYLGGFPSSHPRPVVQILIKFSFPPHQIAILSFPPYRIVLHKQTIRRPQCFSRNDSWSQKFSREIINDQAKVSTKIENSTDTAFLEKILPGQVSLIESWSSCCSYFVEVFTSPSSDCDILFSPPIALQNLSNILGIEYIKQLYEMMSSAKSSIL